ncbi:DUF2848 family protein [Pseudonocardia sp. C8]|uniref:DUF2848 family protein n=1 Tax=Pseudonocardia sp. C8 TaxID=2762759 RepID=UPI0016428DE8|nr:DUF2848 family protein [Pseudonocardia sp. C8]MBC3190367.1 DUF2848 family protein [Pseudonocardia sp. C8]
MNPSQPALVLTVLGTDETLHLTDFQAVVAGYTGRDEDAVRHHIDELAAIGVPEPPEVPMFYTVAAESVTTAPHIEVSGGDTSGEAEPVLVRHDGRWYLGIGSDHTDRERETVDIGDSKRACPKPVATHVVPVPDWDGLDWDATTMSSWVDGDAYQDGSLAKLRRPAGLVALLGERGLDQERDLVCFAGTVPLLTGTFVAGTTWHLRLALPDGRTLTHTYDAKKA